MVASVQPVVHVVDDDEPVRSAIAMLLEACGWRACVHASARDFLSANGCCKDTDCLIMDLNMPDMDGMELLDELRAKGRWFPVIVVTGYPDSNLAARARHAGVRAVLKKPFNDKLLMDLVRKALDVDPHPATV